MLVSAARRHARRMQDRYQAHVPPAAVLRLWPWLWTLGPRSAANTAPHFSQPIPRRWISDSCEISHKEQKRSCGLLMIINYREQKRWCVPSFIDMESTHSSMSPSPSGVARTARASPAAITAACVPGTQPFVECWTQAGDHAYRDHSYRLHHAFD